MPSLAPIALSQERHVVVGSACLMISCYLFANAACVPALPHMRAYFSASTFALQNIVIVYTLALGVAQLIYGPLSDSYGRRKIALLGTSLFVIGGCFSLLVTSIQGLLLSRCLQGLGAGCYSVTAKSMTHDVCKDKTYINATIIMMVFTVLTQMLAPVLGGYLVSLFSWRANFMAIFIYSLITFAMLYRYLPETHQGTDNFSLPKIIKEYKQILTGFRFWGLLLISALTLGAITLYQMVSPFIIQEHMRASSVTFGWSMVISSGGFLIGNGLLLSLNRTRSFAYKLTTGISIMMLGGFCMLLFQSYLSVAAMVLPFSLFNIGSGIVFPLTTAGALLEYPTKPGLAGALIGSLQMVLVGLMGLSATHIQIHDQYALGQVLMGIVGICVVLQLCMQWMQSNFTYGERVGERNKT